MQMLKRIVMVVTALLLLAIAGGFLLPTAWQVQRSVVIQAPPAAVFPVLNSLKRWRDWTVWFEREPDVQVEYSGPDSGVGATSRWSGRDGRGALKIMRSDSDRRVEYQLLFDGGEFAMDGVLLLAPEATGTRVTWRAGGEVGANPFARYFALMVSYWIGRDFEASLENLRARLESGG